MSKSYANEEFILSLPKAEKLLNDELEYESTYGGFPIDIKEKEKYINSQCSTKTKIVARAMLDAFRYIPEKDFVDKLGLCCKRFIEQIDPGKRYLLAIDDNSGATEKSNYFYSQIGYARWLKDYVTPVSLYDIQKLNKENTIAVCIDDAMYSGDQMSRGAIRTLASYRFPTILIVPFITDVSIAKLKPFHLRNIIFEEKMYRIIDLLPKSFHEYLPSEIRYTGRYTTYFYHKVGDYISSYPESISSGFLNMNDGKECLSQEKVSHIVTNCPREKNGKKRVFSIENCPPPYYKDPAKYINDPRKTQRTFNELMNSEYEENNLIRYIDLGADIHYMNDIALYNTAKKALTRPDIYLPRVKLLIKYGANINAETREILNMLNL